MIVSIDGPENINEKKEKRQQIIEQATGALPTQGDYEEERMIAIIAAMGKRIVDDLFLIPDCWISELNELNNKRLERLKFRKEAKAWLENRKLDKS